MAHLEANLHSAISLLDESPKNDVEVPKGENPYEPPHSDPVPSPVSPVSPAPRLWNPDAAGAWSLLFTPVFGSILLLKNWQAIGREDKIGTARIWLIISIVMFVLMIVVNLAINVTIFNVSFVIDRSFLWYYIFIWYFAWQKPQTKYVKEQWGKNYPRKSWKKPLLIVFGCWGGSVILYVFIFSLIQS